MAKRKRASHFPGGFVIVPKLITGTPAWRAMSPGARLLWIELRGWLRNDGLNNGKVFLTCRDAAKAIGTKATSSIVRWYQELEHHGFLVKTAHGFLGSDGHGIGDHYRFTDIAHGTNAATHDFEKWQGEIFAYTRRRCARKKQNPVLTMSTRRAHHEHIQAANVTPSVCAHHEHIDEALSCAHHEHVSSLPPPEPGGDQLQGSSTERAPAQAGEAGSSPAPVAKRVRVPKRGTEVHRAWAEARRKERRARLRLVRHG